MYPSLTIPAPRRLAMFRAAAEKHVNGKHWKDARYSRLSEKYSDALSGGQNGKEHIWCAMNGEYFRNERDAHDVVRLDHSGYYTDGECCSDLAIGIVASLPHGRFLAGYRLTMNDERVYFGEIFDDEDDAARMADEHARIIGESESEYSERWREADKLQTLIEAKGSDIAELREKHSRFADLPKLAPERAEIREQVAEIIEDIRGLRRDLQQYSDVL